MDQVTQQNAALVEEMAAAASSLQNQAQDLVQTVAVFHLREGDGMGTIGTIRTGTGTGTGMVSGNRTQAPKAPTPARAVAPTQARRGPAQLTTRKADVQTPPGTDKDSQWERF